jgi:hypothetical protein
MRTRAAVLLLVAALVTTGLSPQRADRKAPTTPKNLRVTGTGSWTVSLKWDPSTDNGPFKYVVQCSNGRLMDVPQSQTTVDFNNFSEHWGTFSFRVFAVDFNNNWSKPSNQVSAQLQPDVTPPTQPTIELTEAGPRHVDLEWSATDDGPNVWYSVYVNGALRINTTRETTGTLHFLEPETSYTVKVIARDGVGQLSAPTETTVTTTAFDPNDHQPPTTPPGMLDNGGPFGDGELMISWGQSTDNVTASEHMRYFITLNGVLDGASTDEWRRAVVYLHLGQFNVVEVWAVDEAGNASPPVVLTYDLR